MNVDSRNSSARRRDETQPEMTSAPEARRIFLSEPGWRVAQKVGSERSFCYMMAPGQDYYHRLVDGEIYVYHGDERICLACAERRGLLSFEPRTLRAALPMNETSVHPDANGSDFDLKYWPGDEEAS